VSRSGS